jgi:hypothetical protein
VPGDHQPEDLGQASSRVQREGDVQGRAAIERAIEYLRAAQGKGGKVTDLEIQQTLALHGVEDATDEEVRTIRRIAETGGVRSSLGFAGLGFKRLFQIFRDLKRAAEPRWVRPPSGISSVASWRDDQEEAAINLEADPLRYPAISRIFAELPNSQPVSPERPHVRTVECWISAAATADVVDVYVGELLVGCLVSADAALANRIIEAHGGARRAVRSFLEVHGDEPKHGHLTLFLPDKP